MKYIYIFLFFTAFSLSATAQRDTLISIGKDTITLGGLKIIKNRYKDAISQVFFSAKDFF